MSVMQLLRESRYEFSIADDAVGLLLSQYENAPNLHHYLKAIVTPLEVIKHDFEQIVRLKDIEKMAGDQLDMVGEVVGLERVIRGASPTGFFGYYEHSQSDILGDESGRPNLDGGVWKSEFDKGGSDFHMSDEFYRRAIRARVIKLHSKCRMEDIYQFACLIANSDSFEIKEDHKVIHVIYHGKFGMAMRSVIAMMLPEMKPTGIAMTLADDTGNIALNVVRGLR